MNVLFFLALVITALDFGSTHQSSNSSPSKKCITKGLGVPKFKIISLYDNVTLTCPFTSGQTVNFFKNCKPITQSAKFNISGKALTLTKYIVHDNGKYSCQAHYADGRILSYVWMLHIKFPKSEENMKYKERPVDGDVMMDCRRFKGKRLFYSHKRGATATEVTSPRLVANTYNGIYELSNLNIDDSGYYYCGKISGDKMLLLHLLVKELPKVKGPTLAKTGDSIKFVCEYRGRQTIAWYKDKVRIPQPNAQKKNTTIGNAKTRIPYGTKQVLKLELANVQPSARGEYSCGATFDNSITAYRTILFDIFEFLPSFGFYGDKDTPNMTVYLQCESNQYGKATYSLLKRSLDEQDHTKYKKVKIGAKVNQVLPGVFEISSLGTENEGYYRCRASFNGLTIEKDLLDPIWLNQYQSQ